MIRDQLQFEETAQWNSCYDTSCRLDEFSPFKQLVLNSVHTTPEEFKNVTITDHFGFVLWKTGSISEITRLLWCNGFRIVLFSKCYPRTRKLKYNVFKRFWFEERFQKDKCGRWPNHRKNAAFSNSSGVAWALPYSETEVYINVLHIKRARPSEWFMLRFLYFEGGAMLIVYQWVLQGVQLEMNSSGAWGVNEPRNSAVFRSQNCFEGMYRHRYVQKCVLLVCYNYFNVFKSIPGHSVSTQSLLDWAERPASLSTH